MALAWTGKVGALARCSGYEQEPRLSASDRRPPWKPRGRVGPAPPRSPNCPLSHPQFKTLTPILRQIYIFDTFYVTYNRCNALLFADVPQSAAETANPASPPRSKRRRRRQIPPVRGALAADVCGFGINVHTFRAVFRQFPSISCSQLRTRIDHNGNPAVDRAAATDRTCSRHQNHPGI